MSAEVPAVIDRWHRLVASRDVQALHDILDAEVVFESPVVHAPQAGRAITLTYLKAALLVLNNDKFRYVGEYFAQDSAVLEFTTEIDGITRSPMPPS